MSADNEVRIYISRPHGWAKWFRHLVGGMTMLMAPIAIGIICNSSAMQWVGFFLGLMMLVGLAKQSADKTTFITTAEVRAYLDKIDAGEAP